MHQMCQDKDRSSSDNCQLTLAKVDNIGNTVQKFSWGWKMKQIEAWQNKDISAQLKKGDVSQRRQDCFLPAMSWVIRQWNLSSLTAGLRRRWWSAQTARAQSTQTGALKPCNGCQIEVLCSFFPNCCGYEQKLLNIQYEEWQNQQQLRKHKLSIQWGKLAKFRIFPQKFSQQRSVWLQARPKTRLSVSWAPFVCRATWLHEIGPTGLV